MGKGIMEGNEISISKFGLDLCRTYLMIRSDKVNILA